jgi:hypothetical protein
VKKLRQDMTVTEFCSGMFSRGEGDIIRGLNDFFNGFRPTQNYPDSFYESPPIGSFGQFWDTPHDPDKIAWGHLHELAEEGPHPYLCDSTWRWYDHFKPCVPQDVDKDGYPK